MTINNRIGLLINALELNNNSFSTRIGVNPTVIHNIVKGRNAPSYDVIQKILLSFDNISADWLITSNGSMFKNEVIKPILKSVEKVEESKSKDKNSIALTQDLNITNVSIPLTDIKVAAGNGTYNGPLQFDEYIQLPQHFVKRGAKYYCVRVKGDSMSPTLQDSSYIIIRHLDKSEWELIPDEHIYVVVDKEGKSFIKRVKNRFKKGFIVLMSDNADKVYNPNFNLTYDEIVSIFHAEWYISAKMPNINNTMFGRLKRLEDIVENLMTK